MPDLDQSNLCQVWIQIWPDSKIPDPVHP